MKKLNSFNYMCKLNIDIILTTCYKNKEINRNEWNEKEQRIWVKIYIFFLFSWWKKILYIWNTHNIIIIIT